MKSHYLLLGVLGIFALALVAYLLVPTRTSEVLVPETATTTESGAENPAQAVTATGYSLAQVSEHAVETDCWTAIAGSVYDLTPFVAKHPGGPAILKICGKDGTAIFENKHGGGEKQAEILATLRIGALAQ